MSDSFTLAAPESIEQQKLRLAEEQAKADDQRRREHMAARAAAPLVGAVGDIWQTELAVLPGQRRLL